METSPPRPLPVPPAATAARGPHGTRRAALGSILVFVLALAALSHVLTEFTLAEVEQEIHAIGADEIALSLFAVFGSYALLTFFDWQGLRLVGRRLPTLSVLTTSFVANALGHNLGIAALTGGAVRARGYGAHGLGVLEVGQVVASNSLGFALGALVWLAIACLSATETTARALHLPPLLPVVLGVVLVGVLLALPILAWRGRREVSVRGRVIRLPGPLDLVAATAVSTVELALCALALYALLPDDVDIEFLPFASLYIVAVTAGLLSSVPAGVGVFEASLMLLLPGVPAHTLLGTVLVYRALYYAVPLAVAFALLGVRRLGLKVPQLARGARRLRRFGEPLVGPAIALAAFVAGAMLVLSGSIPVGAHRRTLMRHLVPLPLFELSHLAASALGVGLLLLAHGLYRRLDAAWATSVVVIPLAALSLLTSGFRWELSVLVLLLLPPLLLARARYDRTTPLTAQAFSPTWLRNIALVLAASVWIGLFAYRHVEYANDLWWRFAFESDAPRMLRASLGGIVVLAGVALWQLLRPFAAPAQVSTAAERDRAAPVVAAAEHSDAHLALLPDKQLLFGKDDRGLVMYQRSGPCLIAMGDPIGPPLLQQQLAWRFRELADRQGLWPVFYQVSAAQLPTYLDLGLSLIKLGEEAVVPLAGFSLDGAERASLRQSHRRAERDGAVFEVRPRAELASLLPELGRVSADWLEAKDQVEKGFSLGWFDPEYLGRCDLAVVSVGGRVVAFANLWCGRAGGELSFDLMRYAADAPKGVMDFLICELLLWGRARGYRDGVLGMAPLSGLSEHHLAPAWHKLGGFIWRHGEAYYNFEGLRRYKQKFAPEWRPRYLAAPSGLRMPRALLEVSRLIAASARSASPARS